MKNAASTPINIIWYKRDLRTTDHEPLCHAQDEGLPLLAVYFMEPSVMNHPDSDPRHWRFAWQSFQALNSKISAAGGRVYLFHREAEPVLEILREHFTIKTVFSSQETGNSLTFRRDLRMAKWFQQRGIIWREFQNNGVIRGLNNRKNWDERWHAYMNDKTRNADLHRIRWVHLDDALYHSLQGEPLPEVITRQDASFQPGGEDWAWKYLEDFIRYRHIHYTRHISKPEKSRRSCSRLSPYLAYGNISLRSVYQYTLQNMEGARNKSALSNFISRLHWHCHFIQKFESECRYEHENINRAYDALSKEFNEAYYHAWLHGKTGIPIVDACMRCLRATGYVNFRMRAMVVSFAVYNLWLDWRHIAQPLARLFLDYEPGIHYPQLQMQSGTTGVNTLRIYNPVKNSEQHDPDGEFIKKWVPELAFVPGKLIHEPHRMSFLEQRMYNCIVGKDYPAPIVSVEETRKRAADIMWAFKKKAEVKEEGKRILARHVRPRDGSVTGA
ncbi:MAG: DNA photolyase family protein [Chitinophagales bacterium]|nr:DNA photolyase family protein [Chitinophagales bacterium]MDW8420019.1 deoxyribodipyrimidine photo-lyase [Chitinophagales bacterium]